MGVASCKVGVSQSAMYAVGGFSGRHFLDTGEFVISSSSTASSSSTGEWCTSIRSNSAGGSSGSSSSGSSESKVGSKCATGATGASTGMADGDVSADSGHSDCGDSPLLPVPGVVPGVVPGCDDSTPGVVVNGLFPTTTTTTTTTTSNPSSPVKPPNPLEVNSASMTNGHSTCSS